MTALSDNECDGRGGHRAITTSAARFEVGQPDNRFAFGAADLWRVLVTHGGVPTAYVELADPGETDDPALTALTLRRASEVGALHQRTIEALANRLGAPPLLAPRPTCSVVLCTHRRPEFVAQAIAALQSLDPPADEILVVDNAPDERDCRAIAEAAGVRYLNEKRRGQNQARATGLAQASCDLVAFTDDDVIVAPVWLRPLAELFADPAVGAATGVAIGRELATPAQNLRESFAGFIPGMRRRDYDWTNLRPVASGAAGAGANMIFRRELLLDLDVFAPELDTGTPTCSGGDLYALYRTLAAGWRIAFDPRLYAEHQHRREDAALRETLRGYGTGFSAFLSKALVEHRELTAPLVWCWLPRRLIEALLWHPLAPHPGLVDLRARYLLSGLRGPLAWMQSRDAQRGRTRPARASPGQQSGGSSQRDDSPPVSMHDSPRASMHDSPSVSLIRARSAADRNHAAEGASSLLLFLDPDCRPADDLAERHAACHASGGPDRIVLGRLEPCAESPSLATQLTALWWRDHFKAKGSAAALTFADMTASNVSIPRTLFERLGGFDERLGPDASAQELALRALQAGVKLEYEPRATARLRLAIGTRDVLGAARSAGKDHASIAVRHPISAEALPATIPPCDMHSPRAQALVRHLPLERLCRIGATIADAVEGARLRGSWLWIVRWLAGAAYVRGFAVGRGHHQRQPALTIDLAADTPLPKPVIAAPRVEVCIGEQRIATFRPRGGQWGRALADQIVNGLDAEAWRQLARLAGSDAAPATAPPPALDDTVVVFGPAHRLEDRRHAAELTAAGARVVCVTGDVRDHWAAIASAIAEAPERHAALALPGVSASAAWLATALVPLAGDRVALVCGTGVPRAAAPLPTTIVSRTITPGLYQPIGIAPQFAVVSTRHVAQIGGLDPGAGHFGMHAPLIDLIERALEAGFVVASQETPGIEPPGSVRPVRSRLAWERAWARGGLLFRAATERGPIRGSGLLAGHLIAAPLLRFADALTSGDPSARVIVGSSAGELAGCVHALMTFNRWSQTLPARSVETKRPDVRVAA